MRVLGIDPAKKCGWAVLAEGRLVDSGTWLLTGSGGSGLRFLMLQRHLEEAVRSYDIDTVFYERPGHLKGDAILAINGLVAIVEAYCEGAGLSYREVSPGEAKMAVGCAGNAGKPEVMAAVERLYPGAATRDDNEADAIAIALAGIQQTYDDQE